MKNLIRLLILVSVNTYNISGMTAKNVKKPMPKMISSLQTLQTLCINYMLENNLIPMRSDGMYDFSRLNTEVTQKVVIQDSSDALKQVTMLYKIPDTIFADRQQCVQNFLKKYAIIVCAKSKTMLSLDGKELMPALLQEDILKEVIDAVRNFIEQDSDIPNVKKEALKYHSFTLQEGLWLFSFYKRDVAFADSTALSKCDDALQSNDIVFNENVRNILLERSKKLRQIQPKYMWDPSKLSKNPRIRSRSH